MLAALLDALPAYAGDVKRTLTACLEDETLSENQKWACIVSAAQTLAAPALSRAVDAEAPADIAEAARGVAAVMAINNVYFRAVHLMASSEYAKMRSGVRMNALNTTVIPSIDVDLAAIAASAINGCGVCMDDHEAKLRKAGAPAALAHAALKLAGALAGLGAVLSAEAARA
jgi:lipoyl-dependent peroxiredoxin subunit D